MLAKTFPICVPLLKLMVTELPSLNRHLDVTDAWSVKPIAEFLEFTGAIITINIKNIGRINVVVCRRDLFNSQLDSCIPIRKQVQKTTF